MVNTTNFQVEKKCTKSERDHFDHFDTPAVERFHIRIFRIFCSQKFSLKMKKTFFVHKKMVL